jgi:transcriptional regulator with XRE-family HTH domain
MPLTPQQCRAARGLLDWTQEELAGRAGVSRSTVRGFENGQHELHRGSAAVIRGALEAAGVILIEGDEEAGPGVRLRGECIRRLKHGGADAS